MKIPISPISRIDLWVDIINQIRPRAIAEIGVWKADFSVEILRRCPSVEHYVMIDPWAQLPDWNKPFNVSSKEFDEIYNVAMVRTEFASAKIEVLRGRTREVIHKIEDGSLDFVYIDGDHTLRGITIDLINILPKIRSGGCVAGDDFMRSPWVHSSNYEPTLVCPFAVYFAEAVNLPITILPYNQFMIIKDNKMSYEFEDLTGGSSDFSLVKLKEANHFFWGRIWRRFWAIFKKRSSKKSY